MAEVIRRFTATIPAGTAKASPVTVTMNFPPMEVVEIEVVVPPGPNGTMGFKIAQAGGQVFPFTPDDYIVTNNETIKWEIEGANTSGAWQVIGYNTGSFNHSIEVRFLLRLIDSGVSEAPAPVSNADLSNPPPLPPLELPAIVTV